MSRQRRHTISGPRLSTQDIVAAGSQIFSTNGDPAFSSAISQADHEMVDATTQTSDQTADIADMPPLTGANNNFENFSALAQSRSNRIPGLTEAFTRLGTGDESRSNPIPDTPSNPIPHTPSNPRPDTPSNPRPGTPSSTATIPVAVHGLYELFDHVPRQTFLRVVRDIPMTSFDAFVGALVQSGLLDWEDDDLPINPPTRVAIMALTFQQLASPAKLNLPPDVVETIFIDVSKAIGLLCGRLGTPQWILDVATKLRGLKDITITDPHEDRAG